MKKQGGLFSLVPLFMIDNRRQVSLILTPARHLPNCMVRIGLYNWDGDDRWRSQREKRNRARNWKYALRKKKRIIRIV